MRYCCVNIKNGKAHRGARRYKMTYAVEMKVNGEWKVWQTYDEPACGVSPKERAEMGLHIARCYGECRIVEKA